MEDTSGFYKYQNDELFYGQNFVQSPTFELLKGLKDSYTYPVDGWYYFDTETEAKTFFNITV